MYAKVWKSIPFSKTWLLIVRKIDNCFGEGYGGPHEERFRRWSDALTQVHKETGIWMYYSFVEWQSFDAWEWGGRVANTWRSKYLNQWLYTGLNFLAVYDDINFDWPRVVEILNNASFIGDYTNFYGRNDLGESAMCLFAWSTLLIHIADMLENGNGDYTLAEQRTHFTAWALTKSPLLVGTDVSCCLMDCC